jgi:signal transduction histidine kinase
MKANPDQSAHKRDAVEAGAGINGPNAPSAAGLRMLADRVPVIVWSTDENLCFTSLTGAGLRALELHPGELVGRSLREYFGGDGPDAPALAAHQRALRGESMHLALAYRDREYELHVEPLADESSRIIGTTGVALDVTEQTQMMRERGIWQAHARHQQRLEAIGTLASGVAHEINNPVQSIMNYAQLIARRAGSSEVPAYAQEILQEAQRVAAIVKSLLSFARQEGEPYTDVYAGEVVASTLALVSAMLRKEGIRIDLDLAPDMPPMRCHPQQIQQVLMNLLGNAREALNACFAAGHDEKRILIIGRCWRREGKSFVRLTIEDHGIGIPPGAIDKVFDPFWTSKTDTQAAGLGLSVSQGIVVEHGGAINGESEPGRFTRVHVDLPAAGAPPPASAPRTRAAGQGH